MAACSAQPAAQTTSPESTPATAEVAVHPTSGLAIIPLQVTDGHDTHSFRVELAATVGAQAKGMMFRTEMAPDEGMLFPSRTVEVRGFWMKNTPLPLDIIFIGADGRIINIAENTVPYSLETVYSEGPAGAVLELAGGRAAELGIKPGDMVEYSLPE
ncbi:MAG: DUF192 domain-containing protein [Erythrobacter sp.]